MKFVSAKIENIEEEGAFSPFSLSIFNTLACQGC